MPNKWLTRVSFLVVALTVVAAVPPANVAQEATGERAITRSHRDPQFKWGPCPPIFPTGCEVTVLRRDPANGGSDVFLKTPANYKLPLHWHTSPEHMILVAGEMHVTYEGQKTATLIVTEFGRTVAVNGTRGTDHGTASCAFLVGGAVAGGRVVADWPGLAQRSLYQSRDLQPTMDARSVFKGVLASHLGVGEGDLERSVFPESRPAATLDGLIRPTSA